MDNLAATSEEEIVVHRELIPSTSHQHAALKDIGMSQHDDRSVQIKAGKAEVKYCLIFSY